MNTHELHAGHHHGTGARALITLAVVVAVGVAVLGGVRSFEAVSARFGSPLVPLTADGMIVACTALRLAALTRGWRLPGSLLVTYVFIVGTVWLNVAAAHGWADAIAHGLAPAAYAVLVEMLAHMLRLQLRLSQPPRQRVSALTWATSPVITTRVWLHLARTGSNDPAAARALTQQVVRMRSRLRSVCPNGWHPFDGARPARTAALHTIRDGLLSAAEVAALLPENDRLTPSELLARIDHAALTDDRFPGEQAAQIAPGEVAPDRLPVEAGPPQQQSDRSTVEPARTDVPGPVPPGPEATGEADRTDNRSGEGAPARPVDPASPDRAATEPSHAPVHRTEPNRRPVSPSRSWRQSDEDLMATLLAHSRDHKGGAPLSQREIRKVLAVGAPKARRLADAAGWTSNGPGRPVNHGPAEAATSKSDREAETEPQQLEMSDAR